MVFRERLTTAQLGRHGQIVVNGRTRGDDRLHLLMDELCSLETQDIQALFHDRVEKGQLCEVADADEIQFITRRCRWLARSFLPCSACHHAAWTVP